MISDGYGYKVNIPAVMIDYKDGKKLATAGVVIKIDFLVERRATASLHLFLDNANRRSYYIIREFEPFFKDLRHQLELAVSWRVVSKEACSHCGAGDCIGPYCMFSGKAKGKELLEEALTEHFLLQKDQAMFFKYMEAVEDECEPRAQRFECGKGVLAKLGQRAIAQQAEEEIVQAMSQSDILERWL